MGFRYRESPVSYSQAPRECGAPGEVQPRKFPRATASVRLTIGQPRNVPEDVPATVCTPDQLHCRHMNLDPGVLGADDQLTNLRAVREGTRVFSAYELRDGTRIWIITEADRLVTTILLPEEY